MKQFKIFLAIYFPVFIICGILYHKDILGVWAGYVLGGIALAFMAYWLIRKFIIKK